MDFAQTLKKIENALPDPMPRIVMERGLARKAAELLAFSSPAIVCDPDTYRAFGEPKFCGRMIGLPPSPHPDMETVEKIRAQAKDCDGLVAIGSGTINDLVKYAAALDGKPYAVFPAAPSMNGYVSANASIIIEGKKQSVPAKMPVAVWCDLDVLEAAPARMIAAGVGDVLCRSTAQADWLLSHHTKNTPYDARPFEWLLPYEEQLLKSFSVELLMQMLLISGFGMTLCGGSYPASQGEHMIAHTYESRHPGESRDPGPLHGEQIALTTLTMSDIQWKIIRGMDPGLRRDDIMKVMRPTEELRAALKAAGCPTTPEEIGWDVSTYKDAVANAKHSRDRFTFLNLV